MELITHVFKNKRSPRCSELQSTSDCLHRLEDKFKKMVGESSSQEITLEQFKLIIHSSNETFAERMFKVFDANHSGTVSLSEFMTSMWNFTRLDSRDKLKYLFDIYDLDGDGCIDHEEIGRVIRACMEENGLKFSQPELDELADLLFEDVKSKEGGAVTFDSFEQQLQRQPGLVENICASLDRWLLPDTCPKLDDRSRWKPRWPHKLTRGYVLNNMASCAFFAGLLAVHAALMVVGAVRYRDHNGWVQMARACGMCLNLDSALILVFVLRRSISWLRSLGLGAVLPLDHHVYYHKLIGWTVGLLSLGHTAAHVANLATTVSPEEGDTQARLLTERLFSGRAMITGWVLLLVLTVITLCSLPLVRRSGRFEVFYYSHLLFLVYWAVLLAHGPWFWAWFLAPGLLFLVESLLRLRCNLAAKTYIERGVLLPSKVTHLVIKRPADFRYSPGDYVYVNIPAIARYEWHPFTISNAPEQQGELWLHIRAVGGWTNRLYGYFQKQEKRALTAPSARTLRQTLRSWSVPGTRMPLAAPPNPAVPEDEEGALPLTPITPRQLEARELRPRKLPKRLESIRVSQRRASRTLSGGAVTVLLPTVAEEDSDSPPVESCSPSLDELTQRSENVVLSRNPLKIYVDGPYGSPSSSMFRAEHAVLIATGIGVTPYASVLQSLVHRYKEARMTCPQCGHNWPVSLPSVFRLKKVDFFWLNRQPRAFEWFVGLLGQLEAEQASLPGNARFLDIHMFVTSARGRGDVRALGLQLALDLLHRKEQRCLITGLKTRTQPGRPDWKQVFQDLANQNKGKITVFFCGPTQLAKTLHSLCNEFGFMFRKEVF